MTVESTISGDLSTVQCSSLHLTSFAVLVNVEGVEVTFKQLYIILFAHTSTTRVPYNHLVV